MKVLIIRLSSFGDQIHACPAVSDLKKQRPEVEIHWLVQTEFAAVSGAHQAVSKVLRVPLSEIKRQPKTIRHWLEFFRVVKCLRKEQYDVAVDIHGVLKSAVMAVLSGAKVRIGFDRIGLAERAAYWLYHRHFHYCPGMTSVTKLRKFFWWAFDLRSDDDAPDFGLSKKIESTKQKKSGVFFVPFASHGTKMLPLDSWSALARGIHDNYPDLVITLSWGSDQEKSAARQITGEANGYLRLNSHRMDFDELIETTKCYELVVGLDTGITHLANALGVPTVMIFKKSAPELFYIAGSRDSLYLGSANTPPTQAVMEATVLKLLDRIYKKKPVWHQP